ncbi:MAG: mitochondrial fission ELM1 family protein [Myxococcota bacterium]|nr:mitochondrial fission ELM1 family protein [Myxococcota bacterium]
MDESRAGAARAAEAPEPFRVPPRTWLLMGHRAGDNSQVLALGEAIGWPFEIKRFVYARHEILVNWPFATTLAGVKTGREQLQPPWPELILTAGRRNEPIARWIRKQASHPIKLVHVGRPWKTVGYWDLVVTTPQYRLPHVANVLHNETPLHRVVPERLAEAAAEWEPRLAHLPRPYIAVLAGGNSGPYPFDPESGARLGREASAMARALGGSLLITTSARTLPETVEALLGAVDVPSHVYRWAPGQPDNPYFGFLALADRLIATGDSVSMMTEACATGRPVYLFDTGEGFFSMRADDPAGASDLPIWRRLDRTHLKASIYRHAMRYGPRRWTRDIRIVQRRLVDSGRAAWLGEGEPSGSPPPLRDLERAAERVRGLFGAQSPASGAPSRADEDGATPRAAASSPTARARRDAGGPAASPGAAGPPR